MLHQHLPMLTPELKHTPGHLQTPLLVLRSWTACESLGQHIRNHHILRYLGIWIAPRDAWSFPTADGEDSLSDATGSDAATVQRRLLEHKRMTKRQT